MPLPAWSLRSLIQRLPSVCAICRQWPAQAICEGCVARFAQPIARCQRCALPVPDGVNVCGACVVQPPALDACLTAVTYAYPWDDLVTAFKFRSQPSWARAMAQVMRSTPTVQATLDQADWVLPVPLFERRLRERGYNQAWELVRELCPGQRKIDPHLLLRVRDAAPQAHQDRASRLHNLQYAFAAEPLRHKDLHSRRVVLVDDVMTTGATLNAAALALRAAGAAHVTGLVFARTDKKSL
jgi:ComF family protein